MAQTLRISGMAWLVDATLGSQEQLLQRSLVEFSRNTTLKAGADLACTTTAAAIPIGGVTSEDYAFLWNEETDTTSSTYISVGYDSGGFVEVFRLLPKYFAMVPLSPTPTWQAKTNTSTANLRGYILQRNS